MAAIPWPCSHPCRPERSTQSCPIRPTRRAAWSAVEHYQQIAERRIREAQGLVVDKGDQGALTFGEATA